MNFTLSPEVEQIQERIRAFVAERIMPLENDPTSFDDHENIRVELLKGLRDEARSQGLWALSMPKERGGGGLGRGHGAFCDDGPDGPHGRPRPGRHGAGRQPLH